MTQDIIIRIVAIDGDGNATTKPIDLTLNGFGVVSFADNFGNTIHAPAFEMGMRSLVDTIRAGGSRKPVPLKVVQGKGRKVEGITSVAEGLTWTAPRHGG